MCGLRHEATKRLLLTEHVLTYQRALDIVKGMEAVDSNTRSLKTRELPINKVLHRALPGTERKTYYCSGKAGHFLINDVLGMPTVTLVERKLRHIAQVCKSAPKESLL